MTSRRSSGSQNVITTHGPLDDGRPSLLSMSYGVVRSTEIGKGETLYRPGKEDEGEVDEDSHDTVRVLVLGLSR
jgi:hypothetical protein